jgi:hypothetical protein
MSIDNFNLTLLAPRPYSHFITLSKTEGGHISCYIVCSWMHTQVNALFVLERGQGKYVLENQ